MGAVVRSPVRVVAVTQSDPFFVGPFFDSFLDEIADRPVRVVEVVVLPNFNESKVALLRRLTGLYGAVDFARLLGRYVAAQVDERTGTPRSVEAIAMSRGITVRRLRTINNPVYLDGLAEQQVDVLLSVAAPEVFRRDALAAAPVVLNVHSGKLPDYRGMMPTFWALLNGDAQIVVTVHEMAESVDTGAVLTEFPLTVGPDETAFELAARAKRVAGREVARLLARLPAESLPGPRPTRSGGGAYYGFPRRTHARQLRQQGRRLL